MESSTRAPNALAGQSSPYLLQHADNPVQWHPWGPHALELARREDKPILLSIGYSACHWCHVMARESFEEEDTAALMNAHFINVKVDREERPDIDKVYQLAHQGLTGRSGGWPLTVFLLPEDLSAFYAGTYFPPSARHGLPGFRTLLERIAHLWEHRRQTLTGQGRALREGLARLQATPPPQGQEELHEGPLQAAVAQAANHFDPRDGGFGAAPKFPHPSALERLLRHHALAVERGAAQGQALHMARVSLERMALGGLCDQVGGGFARYSTDAHWMIPHFEKMLCDNGLLLALYAQASRMTGLGLFERAALAAGQWALREMRAPGGGLCCSLAADSQGEEGLHYTWGAEELREALEPGQLALLGEHLGFDRAPNFRGRWHPHVFVPLEELARRRGQSVELTGAALEAARARLLARRALRPAPARDDKVLTSWNALMIRGLAVAGRLLDQPDFLLAAEEAMEFIATHLWRDGRLLACWADGQARLDAWLDDHAFLLDALLALLEARWSARDLRLAVDLAECLLARFEDREGGGFFFTAHDHETLPCRVRSLAEDALPAGAGVAAFALQRLGHLLGEARYLAAAERALRAAWPALLEQPFAHNALLSALEEHFHPPELLVLRGQGEALEPWLHLARVGHGLRRMVLAIPPGVEGLPGLLAAREPRGEVTAWLCRGTRCQGPTIWLEDFAQALRGP